MPELRELGQRLLRSLRGSPESTSKGEPAVQTGLDAALAAETLFGSRVAKLPVAVGEALAGLRATAVVDGPQLAGSHELLAWAAGRSLPLVVHARLRGGPGHAEAHGTGHEGWHAVADAGCVQLMAQSAQDVADLTVVARLVAETALVPVLVGMDSDAIADAHASTRLLLPELVDLVGSPGDDIDCPTVAQRSLFGEQRRRLPRWHDLERPSLHGAAQGRKSWALGAAAREPYLHRPVAGLVARAMAAVSALTGRPLGTLTAIGKPAPRVLVTQGSAVELGRSLQRILANRAIQLEVLGLRSLRPLPHTELQRRLAGREVVVLERVSGDLAWTPPLRRELEALGGGSFRSLVGGAGGHPLRLQDLVHAFVSPSESRLTWLGVDFAQDLKSPHPTQQAHLDGLKRAFEEHPPTGLRSTHQAASEGVVVALAASQTGAAATLVHGLLGGFVHTGRGWLHWSPAHSGHPGDSPVPMASFEGEPANALGSLVGWLRSQGQTWKEKDALRLAEQLTLDAAVFEAAWDHIPTPPAEPVRPPRRTPLVVRALGDDDAPDSVRRFWGSVGLPFVEGSPLVPDPGLAVGAIPPLTSSFHDLSSARERMPVFDPDACTGCGDCWVACPEGALGVLAVSSRDLVDVAQQGSSALKPVAGKLARALRADIRDTEGDAGASLRRLDSVLGSLSDERKAAASAALEQGAKRLEGLPLATPFQEDLLLSLVIDPASCTACGSCAQACPHSPALTVQPQTEEVLTHARRAWSVWESLPDTAGPAMSALEPRMGPLAARLLSRHCALALAGGNGEEPGSGAKLTLRAALAMSEAALQPVLGAQLASVEALRSALNEAVAAELTHALPSGASLEKALDDGGIEVQGLTPKDQARLKRRVRQSHLLAQLMTRLQSGTRGLARARVGLVLEPSLAERWGVQFPYNPFQAPAVVAGAGGAVELGVGLLQGQLAQVEEGETLLAEVAEELGKKAPFSLRPPMLVVGHDSLLREEGLRPALDRGLPLKLLLVVEEPSNEDLTLLDLRRHGALVGQSTIGDPDHLAELLLAAMKHPGPAVVRVLAPSPGRHGMDAALSIPHAAKQVKAGLWPLWSLGPDQTLRAIDLRTPVTEGVLYELGLTASLRAEMEEQIAAREKALRAELQAAKEQMRQDEDARFQARLEERLMALAGLLDPETSG